MDAVIMFLVIGGGGSSLLLRESIDRRPFQMSQLITDGNSPTSAILRFPACKYSDPIA